MKRIITLALMFVITINPAVMESFYRDGGSIRYTDSITIDRQDCNGGYYPKNNTIRIRYDAPDTTLAHEMGHYLYHKQVWSGELQEHANQAFASCPLRECTDENFAVGYSMYCSGRLNGELSDFYRACEPNVS